MASQQLTEFVTAQDLKDILMDVLLAAGGCMKFRPTSAERVRLRLTLARALKAHKSPVRTTEGERAGERGNSSSERVANDSSPNQQKARPDPVVMVARYVEQGGNWRDLIAAITKRSMSGQTRQEYLKQTPTKGKDYDKPENSHTRSH